MTGQNNAAEHTADIAASLKQALRRMPGPVSLITTQHPDTGVPAGLAASAVIPVSMEPPSMLIAVNQSASSCAVIKTAGRFCINLLGTTHTGVVGLFSNSDMRERRFESDDWAYLDGIPYLPDACANIFCRIASLQLFGTHAIFVGAAYEVQARVGEGIDPLGWIEGNFARLGQI